MEDLDRRLTEVEKKIKAVDASKKVGDACCCPDADKKCCDACCCNGAAKSNEHLEVIALNTKSSWFALYVVLVLAMIGIAVGWLRSRRREDRFESLASQVKTMTNEVKAMTGDVRMVASNVGTMADETKGLVAAGVLPMSGAQTSRA